MSLIITPRCEICGVKIRSDSVKFRCKLHRNTFNIETGECLLCGKIIEKSKRAHHAQTKCGTISVWNKGKTKDTDQRILEYSSRQIGTKRPEVGRKLLERLKIPEIKERYQNGWSRGQKKRFSRMEEIRKSKVRALQMIEDGKITPFGGRPYGNGNPNPPEEQELFSHLQPYGFVNQYVVITGYDSYYPTHYKIDIAHPQKQIAIEVDGSSHNRSRIEMDNKKTEYLLGCNWDVLRFRIPFDLNLAISKCLEKLKSKT